MGRRCVALVPLGILGSLLGCATPSFPVVRAELPHVDDALAARERSETYARTMEGLRERMLRLERVADRLAVAATPLCGERVVANLGIVALSSRDFRLHGERAEAQRELDDAMQKHLGVDERLRVVALVDGMPAARAGVRIGDAITGVGGDAVDSGHSLYEALQVRRAGPVELGIDRLGVVALPYEASCDVPVNGIADVSFEAFAQKDQVYVSFGLLRFAANDDELAIVVGHEMSHVILRHRFGSERAAEREADYVGLYLAARAGFDVSGAPEFWRRLAEDAPDTVHEYTYSHDGGPERIALAVATIAEIAAQRARGEELLPHLEPR